ncbi:MAG TPA: hypothetical protein VFN13_01460 [Rudaea sp.]|nr:hypothetical protein [Rudaea sp.]
MSELKTRQSWIGAMMMRKDMHGMIVRNDATCVAADRNFHG